MNYSEDVLKKSVFERELVMIRSRACDPVHPEVVKYLELRISELSRCLKERRS